MDKSGRAAYQRQYREAHREKNRAYQKQWYLDNKEAVCEKVRLYKEANQEKVREGDRRWHEANRGKVRETARCWRAANPEKKRASGKRWREKNPGYLKRYREANRDRLLEQGRLYREANPNSFRDWSKKNPEKVRANSRRRRARKLQAPGTFTPRDECRLYELYDHCLRCGETENLSIDHIVPLSKGGANSFENCQVLCCSCNSKKGVQTIDYRLIGD